MFTNNQVGIPQGAVLSPRLMNVVLHRLDVFVMSMCEKRRIFYGRYAGDLTLGITGDNENASWAIIQRIKGFMNDHLGGRRVREKSYEKAGLFWE